MRLHQLELQAFGPFAGTEQVDFDALDTAGLYLIHGATGAGKTSILDAVCYAVYGALPGSRTGHRETIRSDHADPTVQSYVRIEFTAAGERLRIRRSPEWEAPKKRGIGTTRRPATVLLEILRGAQWVAQSTRMDEAAEIVSDHLGLGLEQFAQVVLLPQGEFATFLRARPEDRAALLGRLFDIERFSAAQDWLAARRRDLTAQVRDADTAVGHQADRLVDLLAELDLPPAATDAATDTVDADALVATLQDFGRQAADHATRTLVDADLAARQRDSSRDALQQADRIVELQNQARSARAVCTAYADREPARSTELTAVQASRRAAVVQPVLSRRLEAGEFLRAASSELQLTTDRVRVLVGTNHRLESEEDRAALMAAITVGTGALTGLAELDSQRVGAAAAVRRHADDLHTAVDHYEAAAEQWTASREAVDRIGAELAAMQDSGKDAVGAAGRSVQSIRAAVRTGENRVRALHAVQVATADAERVTGVYAAAEERVLDLRRRRLAGMVGEIGSGLQPGFPCPVCGSEQHPIPAQPTADAASAADVDNAEAAAGSARSRHGDAVAALATARGRHEECVAADALAVAELPDDLATQVGATPDLETLRFRLGEALDAAARATTAQDRRDSLSAQHEETTAALSVAHEDRASAQAQQTAATDRLADAQARLTEIDQRVAQQRVRHQADCWCDPVDQDDPLPRHARLVRAVDALKDADRVWRLAFDADRSAVADLAQIVAAQEFSDARQAEDAVLDSERVRHLEQTMAAERASYDRAVGMLEQSSVADAEGMPAPDLATLQEAARNAEHRRATTAQAVSTADRAVRDLDAIGAAVREGARLSAPVREELRVLGPLADTAAGHGDNMLRMRLTSYVLAARLELVTALANEHLSVMSDGRFTLEHSDGLERGGARSGLGLRVLDAWTGRSRDTASLSGGEAFTASLSLALGLGDAVLHASGGRPLGTLFVDEGFGSLDEQTLDQVMEVLDGLRAGGRSVGIVSHVAELRARIRSQVHVGKTESGSHIQVRAADEDAVA